MIDDTVYLLIRDAGDILCSDGVLWLWVEWVVMKMDLVK